MRPRRGFTLVEAIAALAVMGVLAGAAAPILLSAGDSYAGSSVRAQLTTELSVALDRVVRELRSIPGRAGAESPAAGIDAISATAITWGGDNGISLQGSDLVLTTAGTPAVLLRDVAELAMAAYDEDNAPLALPLAGDDCDAVRRIEVRLSQSRQGESGAPRARGVRRAPPPRAGAGGT
jgi:prepilin-type N-terminal cleavage/methylation domain-containing protein